MFKSIGVKLAEDDIKYSVRLGDLNDRRVEEEPRPLKISFRKLALREEIFNNARNLQKTQFKEVSIVPDLTKQQRDEDKDLRAEADRLNSELSETEALNWQYRCIGRRGERVISKMRVTTAGRGRGHSGHRGRTRGQASYQTNSILTNSNLEPINARAGPSRTQQTPALMNLTTDLTSESEEEQEVTNKRTRPSSESENSDQNQDLSQKTKLIRKKTKAT